MLQRRPERLRHLQAACVLASRPGRVANMPAELRDCCRADIWEAVEKDYKDLIPPPRPSVPEAVERLYKSFPGWKTLPALDLKTLTDDELETARQDLRSYFENIHGNASIAWLPPVKVAIVDTNIGGIHKRLYYTSDRRAAVLMVVLRQLDEFGRGVIRKCPQCSRFFAGLGKKKFCSRRCVEADKQARRKASPKRAADYAEDHALIVWRKDWREAHGSKEPSKGQRQQWLESYRGKRRKAGKPVSTRPAAEVI